jgi:nucleoside-diphosphate-sugar epimerase
MEATRHVIVTGGLGFIGRETISPLIERGYTVHILTRSISLKDKEGFCAKYGNAVNLYPVDLHDSKAVSVLIKKIKASHLLHLAWDTRHGIFWNSADNLDWIVTSKILLQDFIEAGGKRVVAAGTCAEYDWKGNDLFLTEGHSKLLPLTLYGQSKLAFRKSLNTLSQHYKISSAWGRVFFLFGPLEGEKRLVSSAIISLLKEAEFLASAGDQIRDFADSRDVAAGFVALLDSDVTGDVNIASGEPVTVANVLNQIGEILDRRDLIKLGARPKQQGEPARLVASVKRLREEVKFSPASNLDTRLQEVVDWWRINKRL